MVLSNYLGRLSRLRIYTRLYKQFFFTFREASLIAQEITVFPSSFCKFSLEENNYGKCTFGRFFATIV